MIRMRIKNIIVGMGPLPSAVILRPAEADEGNSYSDGSLNIEPGAAFTIDKHTGTLDELPIALGMFDAACIARGLDGVERPRPMTHNLLDNIITVLAATLESVTIQRVEKATFYASIDIRDEHETLHHVDARPSDAIALAVRAEVPIFASEDVLERGGMPNFDAIAQDERARELDEFHSFVDTLSPDDFKANDAR